MMAKGDTYRPHYSHFSLVSLLIASQFTWPHASLIASQFTQPHHLLLASSHGLPSLNCMLMHC